MKLGKQKLLASRALGVSPKRVKLVLRDADAIKKLKEMISREDARDLTKEGIIIKSSKRGNSRTRANKTLVQKKKGRRAGQGSRKGTANARDNTKRKWIVKIRALRIALKKFKEQGRMSVSDYRQYYLRAKGNFFRNKRHMNLYLEQNKVLKEVGGKK